MVEEKDQLVQAIDRGRFMKSSAGLRIILSLTMALALFTVPAGALAAEATVNLGTTEGFAVLAGTTITNTGPTTITGDVGLHPGSAFVDTGVTLIGTRQINNAVAATAKTDLVTAYNDAAGRPVSGRLGVDLGGLTLTPGVYDTGGVVGITGLLTLDAGGDPDAVFIIKSTATLITAANSEVRLINGARFCRVFWVVPSSATLGTDSIFVGHILALTSITADTRARVEGQLLARNGQVSLAANVVTNEICAATRVIRVTKSASPRSLPNGPGDVTYTYQVTNPGTVELSDVKVADDKISSVRYVSGDVNRDSILQPGETWTYRATARLSRTTSNVVTATGSNASFMSTDTATLTVDVGSADTEVGQRLPDTATPWSGMLLLGGLLTLFGAVGWAKNRIHA